MMISCLNCGELTIDDIRIYMERLRKQRFDLLPIRPTCKRCGAEAAVTQRATGGQIIVLNGTCGSGKATIAEIRKQIGQSTSMICSSLTTGLLWLTTRA